MMDRREKCCSIFLFILGTILFIIGIIIVALMPMLTKKLVDDQVPLKENSFIQRTWQDPPFDITMEFFIFNVTNPLEVVHSGAKPALVQRGPYTYTETQNKKQVKYLEDDTQIQFVNQKVYIYNQSLSCAECRPNDKFTIPNIPYLAAVEKASGMSIKGQPPSLIVMAAQGALLGMGEQLFINDITAAELLFDGYKDKIIDLITFLQPGTAPDRMGLFYGKNNTDDGVYVIDSGIKNVSAMGQIISWNGHPNLTFKNWWNSSDADRIMGSDGTLYPPFVKRSDILYAYVSDICRTIYLTYSADIDFHGIKAYRFRLAQETFNASLPENLGFCWPMKEPIFNSSVPHPDGGWCLPSGMNDISKCQYGLPIVASMPQFIYAPEEVRNSVTGLQDPIDKYLSFVDIEPTSGVLLTGGRMIQLNIIMQPVPGDVFTKNMKPVIVPLAWVNETVMIDPGTRTYVYQNAVVIRQSAYVAAYAAMGVGLIWMVCVAVGLAVSRYNSKLQRNQFLKVETN